MRHSFVMCDECNSEFSLLHFKSSDGKTSFFLAETYSIIFDASDTHTRTHTHRHTVERLLLVVFKKVFAVLYGSVVFCLSYKLEFRCFEKKIIIILIANEMVLSRLYGFSFLLLLLSNESG